MLSLLSKETKKDCCISSSLFLSKLLSLNLAEATTIVGQAIFAHPVGQPIGTALGAGNDTGSLQLPVGAAPLIASCLGHFSLRNRHW